MQAVVSARKWMKGSRKEVEMPGGRARGRTFRRAGSTRVSFMSTNSQASIKTLSGVESEFLHSAEFGDIPSVKRMVAENPDLNVDCIDILGRTALKLAVKNEHLEIVELLLDKSSINHIYEAALQAISAGHIQIAECILKHKRYLDLTRDRRKFGATDDFFTALDLDESQFSPDLTPLILAAQKNQYEIVQLLLLRGEIIPRPHRFNCHCKECSNKNEFDQLRLAISRLNAYRGLASEAYVSLNSKDPILAAFELASELRRLAHVEKYFRTEYYQLADNLSDYVVKLLDRVRTHDELEMVLNKAGKGGTECFNRLARFKLALRYGEKKFVAHPACQQRLVNIWYAGMRKLERSSWPQRFTLMLGFVILYPVLFLIYLVAPGSKAARMMKYPCVKFFIHAVSFVTFLALIITSTAETSFGPRINQTLAFLHPDVYSHYVKFRNVSGIKYFDPDITLRPFKPTIFQVLLALWIVGFLCQECSQLYTDGATAYRKSLYNMLDYTVLCIYTASFTLFAMSMIKVHLSLDYLRHASDTEFEAEKEYYYTYWLNADRFYWNSFDPINIAEGLFAIGNIISFSRISYLLPANETLGPMQISLSRMIKDILKFLAVFNLVMVAFLVGLHNLFWYYSASDSIETVNKNITTKAEIYFGNVVDTFRTVFWSLFGRGEPSVVQLNGYDNTLTEDIGYIIYGAYNVASVTVLLNMLIAMMTRSFENIAEDADVEWKFGRSQLYMDYISRHSVLPVPLNLLTVPKGIAHVIRDLCGCCSCCSCTGEDEIDSTRIKMRRNGHSNGKDNSAYETSVSEHTIFDPKRLSNKADQVDMRTGRMKEVLTYEKVMQRVIKRYIFELEREAEVTEDDFEEIKQDISSFRYEMLNLLKVRDEFIGDGTNMTKIAHMLQCLREDMFSLVKTQGSLGPQALSRVKPNTPLSAMSSPALRKRITEETPSFDMEDSTVDNTDQETENQAKLQRDHSM